jgi:hypothetical protein
MMSETDYFLVCLEIYSFTEVYFFEEYLIDPHLKFMRTDQY